MQKIRQALIAIIVLNVLDALTTSWLILHGETEVNPCMNYVISNFGPSGLLMAKLFIASLFAATMWNQYRLRYVIYFVLIMYICVVFGINIPMIIFR